MTRLRRQPGLRDVAGELDSAIGDQRNFGFARRPGARENRGDLWHSGPADHARRADGTRPHADFHGIRTGRDQIAGGLFGGDVSGDEFRSRESVSLLPSPPPSRASRMAVGGVDDDDIDFRPDQFADALQIITCGADRGADTQSALVIFGGQRIFDLFGDVFDGDQALQILILVDDQQLLDAMLVQECAALLRAWFRPRR